MNTHYQKRLAAEILKCGISRIRIVPSKEVSDALTKEDIRLLIQKGVIIKIVKRGASRSNARKTIIQKKKGRRKGGGSKKGTRKSRSPPKSKWMITVRSLRALLKDLKENGKIDNITYKSTYRKIKGGFFRNKNHMMLYLKNEDLIKK